MVQRGKLNIVGSPWKMFYFVCMRWFTVFCSDPFFRKYENIFFQFFSDTQRPSPRTWWHRCDRCTGSRPRCPPRWWRLSPYCLVTSHSPPEHSPPSPLGSPWSCSLPSRWDSRTGWRAPPAWRWWGDGGRSPGRSSCWGPDIKRITKFSSLHESHLVEFVADKSKCLENCFSISSHCHDPLGTASIADVNFGSALRLKNVWLFARTSWVSVTSSRNLFTMSPFFPIILPTSWRFLFEIIPI